MIFKTHYFFYTRVLGLRILTRVLLEYSSTNTNIKPIFGKVFFDEESIKDLIVNYQQSKIDNQFLSQFNRE